MIRVPNWDTLLFEWAMEQRGKPYVWGETDCGSLVRSAVGIISGEPAFAHVWPYRTRAQAGRRLSETGGVSAVLLAAGWVAVPLTMAQQGDVLIMDTEDGPACGVIVARLLLTSDLAAGVQLLPVPDAGVLLRAPHG